MTDSDNGDATNTATSGAFDLWREAINLSIKKYSDYKAFAEERGLSTEDAVKQRDEAFKEFTDYQLAGIDPQSTEGFGMRNALSFTHDICPDPWRAAFIMWATQSPELQTLIDTAKANPKSFSYHKFIGDVCDAFGKELDAPGAHRVESPYFKAQKSPRQVIYKTRLADGTWRDITQEDLVALARKEGGPHIVHSANHAFLDNQKFDLDMLQDDFSKLFDGSRLPVTKAEPTKDSGHLSAWNKDALGPNDTITVFATNTRENRFLNLGQLFHRLDEVATHKDDAENDKFLHVSPIAEDMVETLLKSIVVDEDIGRIKLDKDASGKPIFFDQSSDKPITLRDDALDIIRRQRYRGFSKGGNDFRDGMRLLVHTLDNKSAVILPNDTSIRDLIDNMSVIVFGLNEKPMAEYYRKHGVNVPIISSKNDITAPPTVRYEPNEPAYNYEGGAKRDDAGNFLDDGHSPTYSVNGMLADWRIRDLLRMHGAISQGQAAITDVNFIQRDEGGYHPNALALEVAHGTSDAMMDKVIAPFNDALNAAGLSGVTIEHVKGKQSRNRYELQGDGLVTPENIKKIQTVLGSLCIQHVPKKQVTSKDKAEAALQEAAAQQEVTEKESEQIKDRPEMPLWVSQSTAYGKMSLMRRYLLDEHHRDPEKRITPSQVVEKATLEPYVHLHNDRGLRQHNRIAPPTNGEKQIR